METKQIEVDCPCCSARLLVDVRTGTILRSRKPGEPGAAGEAAAPASDWGEAQAKVSRRTEQAPGKLDAALQREREKSSRLDDLFRQANDKLKGKDGA
jgi:hypothetical protein